MSGVIKLKDNIYNVGVSDNKIDLFEGQYVVKNGMRYNSYLILDDKIALMDTVDKNFTQEWLDNIKEVLNGKEPDYLIIHHMEPDHSANIENFMNQYKKTIIVSSLKAFQMMDNFFHTSFKDRQLVVSENSELDLGNHKLHFMTAPMVHWPEVIVSYEEKDKILFSADAFGKFGKQTTTDNWLDEARRYYIGIVGKYGVQVQNLLKKVSQFDISMICSLHGPALSDNLAYYLNYYNLWSTYKPEEKGLLIAYTSVYGHTKEAVEKLKEELIKSGYHNVEVVDLARSDMSECVAKAFKYSTLVLSTTTYNADIYPFMKEFINHLTERNFSNRKIGLIENGSWAPMANKVMKEMFEKSKNLDFIGEVHIKSALNEDSMNELMNLKEALLNN